MLKRKDAGHPNFDKLKVKSNQPRLWLSAFVYTFFLLLKRFLPALMNPHNRKESAVHLEAAESIGHRLIIGSESLVLSLPEKLPLLRYLASGGVGDLKRKKSGEFP